MRKNRVRQIIVHETEDMDFRALAVTVSEFHSQVIERRLNQSNLTTEQKIAVIDKVIEQLKLREVDGIIK